jgi:glycosyltransferase involved in cell wall biosynthesis
MTACWRALNASPGVELRIIAFVPRAAGTEVNFDNNIVAGLNCRLLGGDEIFDEKLIGDLVVEHKPDAVILPGWFHAPYRNVVNRPELQNVKFIMGMDTPWKDTWRQHLAKFKLRSYLLRIHRIMVAGERSWQRARALGVPEDRIRRGYYGIDYDLFAPIYERRLNQYPNNWPRRFLYTGRYHPDKGIDILIAAYRKYRASVPDPWPLTTCGMGPMGPEVKAASEISDRGFVMACDLV